LSGGTLDVWTASDVFEIDYPDPNIVWHQDEIFTQLEASGRQDVLEGMWSTFESQKDTMTSMASTIAAKVQSRLLNRESVINELDGSLSLSDIDDVIGEFSRQMILDSEDVNQSTVTVTSPGHTAVAGNTGTATTYWTTDMDGVSPPLTGATAYSHYSDVACEMAVPSEEMSLTVTQDNDNDGVEVGHEVMLWEGQPALSGSLGWRSEGSGESVSVPLLNSYGIISNRSFETVVAGVPTSWTLDSGATTTELTIETGASDVYAGLNAIGLNGTGTDVELRQTITALSITPDRRYRFACAVKSDGLVNGTGALTIEFVSDSGGYSSVASERIEMDTATLNAQTTYGLETFEWLTPKTLPDDLQISIRLENATSAGLVYIDSISFGPYAWANGVGLAIIANSDASQLVRGDRFTKTITNDEGIFQRFFRRYFKAQLPSEIGGNETRPDTLAT
jgi:hypothetical protein